MTAPGNRGQACVSVIVVTWNSSDTIGECLASVGDSVVPSGVETIVIDNASADGTADLVASDFPDVMLIRSASNAGYARANNQAMALASAGVVLLLNPDAVLSDNHAIQRLLDVLGAHPDVAMIGPRLVFADGVHQVGDAGFRPSTLNMICHGLGAAHLLPWLRTLYVVRPDRYGSALIDVDWICGACLMVRRDAVRDAGGLDERVFLYAEDVEWGCRLRGLGYRIAYLPSVRVTHLQGRSEAQATGAVLSTRWLGSLFQLYVRLSGTRWLTAVCAAFTAGFLLRAGVYRALAMVRQARAAHYAARSQALLAYARAVWRERNALLL